MGHTSDGRTLVHFAGTAATCPCRIVKTVTKKKKKWTSAGGVVLDSLEEPFRVYVVKPSNDYGPWCFPKGRVDQGESIEEAALREVREESGVPAKILPNGSLGTGVGSCSITHYFAMVRTGPIRGHDFETEEVRATTFEEARELFASEGNSRDTMILHRAEKYFAEKTVTEERLLRRCIREAVLDEIEMSDVKGAKSVAGSTHVMKSFKLGGDEYYLKFSDEELFDEVHPSLQILVEYLAYRIYGLYPNVKIPRAELVFDSEKGRVGIATGAVKGKMALTSGMSSKALGRAMSAGVFVDAFLANWDAVGTGTGNVIVDKEAATRIDPGGALTFRAQGGRKGSKFGPKAGELQTMFDPSFGGSGRVYQHSDMKLAAKEFASVPWSSVASEIKAVDKQVSKDLEKRGMDDLLDQWKDDVGYIASTLAKRHTEVSDHVSKLLEK